MANNLNDLDRLRLLKANLNPKALDDKIRSALSKTDAGRQFTGFNPLLESAKKILSQKQTSRPFSPTPAPPVRKRDDRFERLKQQYSNQQAAPSEPIPEGVSVDDHMANTIAKDKMYYSFAQMNSTPGKSFIPAAQIGIDASHPTGAPP